MTKKRTPSSVVDEFLGSSAAKRAHGGAPCQTCALENRKEIEEAAKHFNEQRSTRRTTVGWGAFCKHVLSKEPFRYPLKWRSLVNHLEQHCDVEVV